MMDNEGHLALLSDTLKALRILAGSDEELSNRSAFEICFELDSSDSACDLFRVLVARGDHQRISDHLSAQDAYILTSIGNLIELLKEIKIRGTLMFEQDRESGLVSAIQSRWLSLSYSWHSTCQMSPCQGQLNIADDLFHHVFEVRSQTQSQLDFTASITQFNYGSIAEKLLAQQLSIIASGMSQQNPLNLEQTLLELFSPACQSIENMFLNRISSELCLDTLGTQLSRLIHAEIAKLNLDEELDLDGEITSVEFDQTSFVNDFRGSWSVRANFISFNGCVAPCLDDTCARTTCQVYAE